MPSSILLPYCDVFFWTIIGLGCLALLMALERFFALQRSRIDETDLLSGIITNLKHGNINEAIAICEDTPGPVAHIVAEAIRQHNIPRADLVSVLHSEGLSEISRMASCGGLSTPKKPMYLPSASIGPVTSVRTPCGLSTLYMFSLTARYFSRS